MNLIKETQFRQKIHSLFEFLEKKLETLDPDVLECEQIQGSLILTLQNQIKWILSLQPSLQQLWLALASEAQAYHFHWNESTQQWEDPEQKLELLSLLERLIQKHLQIAIPLTVTDSSPSQVQIYTLEHCPYCQRAKSLLTQRKIVFSETLVDRNDDLMRNQLFEKSRMKTFPQIFYKEQLIGGYDDLSKLDQKDQLNSLKI